MDSRTIPFDFGTPEEIDTKDVVAETKRAEPKRAEAGQAASRSTRPSRTDDLEPPIGLSPELSPPPASVRMPSSNAPASPPISASPAAAISVAPTAAIALGPTRESPLTVSELGRKLRGEIERSFSRPVWIAGEVAEARSAATGHVYFTLKDELEDATVDVVAYRSSLTNTMRNALVRGAKILVRGKPGYWVPRGRVQIMCDRVELSGEGARLLALEELKAKLAAEGLFSNERKRPLPREPRRIGVVTSKHGAVIHDISRVAFRRGGARILLAPAQVQGQGAAESVILALHRIARVSDVDVIIVGRGGGSSEDLSCFNDERLARAVAACRVPVVSAVGHDADVTILDFVADARAATPSQAAELVVPDTEANAALLVERKRRLIRAIDSHTKRAAHALAKARHELSDPRLALAMYAQNLETARTSLTRAMHARIVRDRRGVEREAARLGRLDPRIVVRKTREELRAARDRLNRRFAALVATRRSTLTGLAARLEAMSPLAVLGRGYALALSRTGVITDASQVRIGQDVRIRLARGEIATKVIAVQAGSGSTPPVPGMPSAPKNKDPA